MKIRKSNFEDEIAKIFFWNSLMINGIFFYSLIAIDSNIIFLLEYKIDEYEIDNILDRKIEAF